MTSSPLTSPAKPPVGSPPVSPPRVTVIIPTWNWSSVLPCSIGSVLRQTWTDFELLVIGDCCTDDSESVVTRLAQTDSRIRWINLPQNSGQQAGPNNEVLRIARGELIRRHVFANPVSSRENPAKATTAISNAASTTRAPANRAKRGPPDCLQSPRENHRGLA